MNFSKLCKTNYTFLTHYLCTSLTTYFLIILCYILSHILFIGVILQKLALYPSPIAIKCALAIMNEYYEKGNQKLCKIKQIYVLWFSVPHKKGNTSGWQRDFFWVLFSIICTLQCSVAYFIIFTIVVSILSNVYEY